MGLLVLVSFDGVVRALRDGDFAGAAERLKGGLLGGVTVAGTVPSVSALVVGVSTLSHRALLLLPVVLTGRFEHSCGASSTTTAFFGVVIDAEPRRGTSVAGLAVGFVVEEGFDDDFMPSALLFLYNMS
jgi:hypothetical protein